MRGGGGRGGGRAPSESSGHLALTPRSPIPPHLSSRGPASAGGFETDDGTPTGAAATDRFRMFEGEVLKFHRPGENPQINPKVRWTGPGMTAKAGTTH